MKTTYIACAILLVLGAAKTDAEVGDRFDDSVKKHGNPIGKLVQKNQTVYIFQAEGGLIREIYDRNDLCVESDFTNASPEPKEAAEPAPTPVPLPEPEPVPELMPEPVPAVDEKANSFWPYLLLLPPIGLGGLAIAWARKLKKPALTVLETEPQVADRSKVLREQEASLRLSRNEMCFLKALQTAVIDEYNVTFHVDLSRIVDIHNPAFAVHMFTFKSLEPLIVDFVLHDAKDASVSAVVVLCDPKAQNDQRTRKNKFLQEVLGAQGIKLIKIKANYQYDPILIKGSLQVLKASQQSAA
ncbi:DUF2726 domain-containing protein [Pontiella sp.]|uniref:DUF2726 domain-containing protein n=1 Tax=Pontiella sp. TaxID=2837462 RepID=UPI003562FCCB